MVRKRSTRRGLLVLLGTISMVVALRASRRHGDDFLPMVLGRLF